MQLFRNISRREFLQQSATTVALLAAKEAGASTRHSVGMELYTVGADLTKDPVGTLARLAAIGYEEVEVSGFAGLAPAALRKLIDDAGLKCPAAHLDYGFMETAQVLDQAHQLRVPYAASSILLPTMQTAKSARMLDQLNALTADDYKRIAALINEFGRQSKGAGVQYAYHNHLHEFRDLGGGKTGYEILLAETDPNFVQFEADCGWMTIAGVNPIDYFHSSPGRYRVIHVKDFPSVGHPVTSWIPNGPHPTELGRGSIEYKPILAAAQRAGVEHFFVEQDPPMSDMKPLEAAEVDYKYVKASL